MTTVDIRPTGPDVPRAVSHAGRPDWTQSPRVKIVTASAFPEAQSRAGKLADEIPEATLVPAAGAIEAILSDVHRDRRTRLDAIARLEVASFGSEVCRPQFELCLRVLRSPRTEPHHRYQALLDWLRTLHSLGRTTPCLLYTSPSPRDQRGSRMPSSA